MTTSIDPELVAGLESATQAVPGVWQAVAVVRQGARGTAPAAAEPASAPVTEAPLPAGDKPSSEVHGPAPRIPDGAPMTLQDALRQAAEQVPEKGTIFVPREGEAALQSFPELIADAERVLAGLRAAGLRPGDAALFQFDDNRGYITAFWACVLGGFVPTPVAVATTYAAPNAVNRRLYNAWNLLKRPVLLTDSATATALAGVRELWDEPDVRILAVEDLAAHERDSEWFPTRPDSPVFNLLTSGSTGVPKCVQHTNASVAARTWSSAQERGYGPDDVTLIWMPLDHVAIVMYNVRDVFLKILHVNARIDAFLGDPLLWLDWLDEYQATNTWAPNFAFAMINERADEIAGREWDLSRVRAITNAGEPVVAATSHRFLDLLEPHRLPADAMWPAWGMSETCSAVTYACQKRDDHAAGMVVVAPSSMTGEIRYVEASEQDAVPFSEVGPPIPGFGVRIVDDAGATLPQDRMGELEVRGGAMMSGYHNNPDANRDSYTGDGWFRTGDLAFVHSGSVVICGRKKDQIVVRGINFIAHEIEAVVEQADGVRVTFSAAAGIREPGEGSDQLVIFYVPTSWDADALAKTTQEIRAALVREIGIGPDLLVPVTDAEFPKTGSGKIQRGQLVGELKAGRFAERIADEASEGDDTWFFRRQWSPLPSVRESTVDGVRLVFAEDRQLLQLGLEGPVVAVRKGDEFAEEAPDRFRATPGDFRQVLEQVTAHHGAISTVVFAWPLDTSLPDPAARLSAVTEQLTALLKALTDFGEPRLLVLTSGAVHARPGDKVDLGTCALPGLIRTAVTEAPLPVIRQVDLPGDKSGWSAVLRAELADRVSTGVVAARNGERLRARLRPVQESEAGRDIGAPVVPGGLYLVTGGLGGIAYDLAGYLVATYGVRLLLVGRSAATGEKADRLEDLSLFGGVTYAQLDITDEQALREAAEAAEAQWGRPLDGVLHLAGADPTGQWQNLEEHTLARETSSVFEELYSAKVSGTLAIAGMLEDRPEASLVLFGSVNGEFGGHSFGAYSAANTFLVGFADHWRHDRGRAVRCLAWSMWTGVGMNRSQPSGPAKHRGFRSIDPAEGLRSFLTATAVPYHYVIIGLDLSNPLILSEMDSDELQAHEILVAYTTEDTDAATVHKALEPLLRSVSVPVRFLAVPRIPTDVHGAVDTAQLLLDAAPKRPSRKESTPPATDLERRIAVIWSDVLNRPSIGRDDSFFELGGNSLRATRLLAMVGDELEVRLTTHELYQNPTVAGLAAAISAG